MYTAVYVYPSVVTRVEAFSSRRSYAGQPLDKFESVRVRTLTVPNQYIDKLMKLGI